MSALAETDWTVTIKRFWTFRGRKHVVGSMALPDGAGTYNTTGIPLPALGKLGFVSSLLSFLIGGTGATSAEAAPTAAPILAPVLDGTALDTGAVYLYKTTVITPDGESAPSAAGTITTVSTPAAINAPVVALVEDAGVGALDLAAVYKYKIVFCTVDGAGAVVLHSTVSGAATATVTAATFLTIRVTRPAATVYPTATHWQIWRTNGGGSTYTIVPYLTTNTIPLAVTTFDDASADGSLVAGTIYSTDTMAEAAHRKVSVGRPVGYSARATGWNVYRTDGGGSTYKLVATSPMVAIGTPTYTDNIADTSLVATTPPTAGAGATEYLVRVNKSAHKLLLYEEEAAAAGGPLLECDTSEVPGQRSWDFYAIGI